VPYLNKQFKCAGSLAYLSRKNFFVQGILKIERGTQNQVAGIFPLGMVAQFIEFSWNL
jgi:hypothetical protein